MAPLGTAARRVSRGRVAAHAGVSSIPQRSAATAELSAATRQQDAEEGQEQGQ